MPALLTRGLGSTPAGSLLVGGLGLGAPPAIVPEDLLSAIRVLYDATPVAGLELYSRAADDRASLPYAVIDERSAREERRFDDAVAYSVIVGLRTYAASLDEAGRLGDAAWAALKGRNPAFAGTLGVSPLIAPSDPKHGREPGRAKGGRETYTQDREMRVRVVRETE